MNYVLTLILFASTAAWADSMPEVFSFGTSLTIAKSDGNTVNFGNYVSVQLSTCTGNASYYTSCSGEWTNTESMDGFAFDSTVTVTKETYIPVEASITAQVNYTVVASVAPAMSRQNPTSVSIALGQVGAVTDTVSVTGEPVIIGGTSMSYTPTLAIGPATFPTPQPLPQ